MSQSDKSGARVSVMAEPHLNARNIEQGVMEVLPQSCNFAYMNRYTDWLRLPSEDEAIKIYQETYDKSFEEQRTNRQ